MMLICFSFVTASAQHGKQKVRAQQKGFTIEGSIEGLRDGTHLYLTKDLGEDTVARTISKYGKFFFKGHVPLETDFYFIKIDTAFSKSVSMGILLVNKYIKIRSDISAWPEISVEGSIPQDEYVEIIKLYAETKKKNDSIFKKMSAEQNEIRKLYAGAQGDSLRMKIIADSINGVFKKYKNGPLEVTKEKLDNLYKDYINAHSNSIYIPDLILKCESLLKFEGMQQAYNNLTNRAKNSYFGQQLLSRLKQGDIQIGIGNIAPNFYAQAPDGDTLSLTEVVKNGKFTLLDFWASWCSPCREETPFIRKVYEVYHEKGLNILSVTSDSNKEDWIKAIKKDTMPWLHVADNRYIKISKMYGISSIPATFLIDKHGTIIAINLRGEALRKKIEELLN